MQTRKSDPRGKSVKDSPQNHPRLPRQTGPRDDCGTLAKWDNSPSVKWMNGRARVRFSTFYSRLLNSVSGYREVQWFRAEAEMQCWQEQKEKLFELLRTIRGGGGGGGYIILAWSKCLNNEFTGDSQFHQNATASGLHVQAAGGGGPRPGTTWWLRSVAGAKGKWTDFIEKERAVEEQYLFN
ncbi:hypothetical protein C8R46DRAFT_1040667 [Mycena filopes]|nr:hypothetical protein C8R46DRAFT_1040667 [Mycena filopes]